MDSAESFVVITKTSNEFPPRVMVSPYWEIRAENVNTTIDETLAHHVETLGCGDLVVTITGIAT